MSFRDTSLTRGPTRKLELSTAAKLSTGTKQEQRNKSPPRSDRSAPVVVRK
jgi:hypothetical protein